MEFVQRRVVLVVVDTELMGVVLEVVHLAHQDKVMPVVLVVVVWEVMLLVEVVVVLVVLEAVFLVQVGLEVLEV
jgi:hypothetical protein